MFFYLCFPLLVLDWEKTWTWKLLIAFLLLVYTICLVNILKLPSMAEVTPDYRGITSTALVGVLPISRLFEFVIGMSVNLLWRKTTPLVGASPGKWTLFEAGAVLLAGLSMHFTKETMALVRDSLAGEGGASWIHACGSTPFFALLIFVVAHGKGYLSKLLCHPLWVILGEISYSTYLWHGLLMEYYRQRLAWFPENFPRSLELLIFWAILIALSWLSWKVIERPGRKIILKMF
jgi:peptidoglycan/LPS O-acetylase OafA/YrhL